VFARLPIITKGFNNRVKSVYILVLLAPLLQYVLPVSILVIENLYLIVTVSMDITEIQQQISVYNVHTDVLLVQRMVVLLVLIQIEL